jgi:hypothetical protein
VGSRGVFVGGLAVFVSRSRMLLGLFVFAKTVMMFRLMVVMCGGVVVSGGLVVMLTRRMLRLLCHFLIPFLERLSIFRCAPPQRTVFDLVEPSVNVLLMSDL